MRGIGPSGLQNELQLSQDNLRALSEETDGFAVVNRNDFGPVVRSHRPRQQLVLRAGVLPAVGQEGRQVPPHRGARQPSRADRPRAPRLPRAQGQQQARGTPRRRAARRRRSVEALNSPIQVSGLTMRVFAAPFKGTAPNASVLVGVEVRGRDLALEANAQARAVVPGRRCDGQDSARAKTDTLTLNLRPETQRARRADGPAVPEPHGSAARPLPAARGRRTTPWAGRRVGHLRPRDSRLLQAAVHHERPRAHVDVGGRHDDGQARRAAQGRSCPAPPIATQELSAERRARALHRGLRQRRRARRTRWTSIATVRSDEGTILFKNEEERDSKELAGERGGYGFATRIPLTELAPGPVRPDASKRGRGSANEREATRQVRFTVDGARTVTR